ncbi:hypothetical protein NQ315_015510 [Exocentrus adspersus]|uniref:Uncharacterized protein n=1 Tax=Exocentrus adspersus TaxID=1586481 RepID=A0AAV8VP08_9CUCU|nr:hypothetical protein NQ315_015510 [Exocentrus adspersus]
MSIVIACPDGAILGFHKIVFFSEMGIYDLSSTLQLVMKVCNKKAIYVGHSVGATVGYVYGITKSIDAQSYLKGMISLAPIAYLDGIKSYLRFLLPVAEYLKVVINHLWHEVPKTDESIKIHRGKAGLGVEELEEFNKIPFH